jgi:3-methyladenine DNA glycosylase AlkD
MPFTHRQASAFLRTYATPERAAINRRFFKTGKGEYGEGDQFLGVTMPCIRLTAKRYQELPMTEIKKLLCSPWHEDRLLALIIWTLQFAKAKKKGRYILFRAYLSSSAFINNWDLVDVTAPAIVGQYLIDRDRTVLMRFARSQNIWERRIAIVSTFAFIRNGDPSTTFIIAELLMNDSHDLIHKAVGWMLREVGKRCGEGVLTAFLLPRYRTMPRTMLRYAIEHFSPVDRRRWLLGVMC